MRCPPRPSRAKLVLEEASFAYAGMQKSLNSCNLLIYASHQGDCLVHSHRATRKSHSSFGKAGQQTYKLLATAMARKLPVSVQRASVGKRELAQLPSGSHGLR